MKKALIFITLLALIFVPILSQAAIVNCNGPEDCNLSAFVNMLKAIFKFIVDLAIPLATIAIIFGAVLMMTSAGDPGRMGTGKKVLWSAIVGLVLALAASSIINWIMSAANG